MEYSIGDVISYDFKFVYRLYYVLYDGGGHILNDSTSRPLCFLWNGYCDQSQS